MKTFPLLFETFKAGADKFLSCKTRFKVPQKRMEKIISMTLQLYLHFHL